MSTASAVEFVLLAAIWGASFLFMHVAAVEFGAVPTAALRVAIAALFLLPLMLARGHGPTLRRHWRSVFFVGLINSALPFALYSYALLHITTGLSSILNATVPLFGALVAWVWLRERPGASRSLGLAIGFAGVLMLAAGKASFRPDSSGAVTGWAVLACLGATMSYAVSASYTKRYLAGQPALMTATGSQIGATIGLALPALWAWPAHTPGTRAWAAVIAVGVLCTGVAYVLFFRLIDTTGPAKALTVTFVVPVFALFYGATLLAEPITPWMLLCGAVIVCGTALSTGLIKLRL